MNLGRATDAAEVKEAIAFITSIVGEQNLEKRWNELDRQRQSVVRKWHVEQAYALEFAHRDAVEEGALEFGWRDPTGNPPLVRLYSFAVSFRRLYATLSEQARKRLTGSLWGQYGRKGGLRPLTYEMTIIQHLSRMGFRIEFHDLEEKGGFDFLAVDADGTEVEVECKHLSADVGRKIHREDAYTLLDLLKPVLAKELENAREGQVLVVEVPDRLESSRPVMDEIVGLAAAAFGSPNGRAESVAASVSLISEDRERPDTIWDSGHHIGTRFGRLGVILRSANADAVFDAVGKKLKDEAGRQFSATRPSVLFAQVSDLTAPQIVELQRSQAKGVNPLQWMASQVLVSRKHLSAVSLTTLDEPTVETGSRSSVGDRGRAYSFSRLSKGDPAYAAVRRATLGPDANGPD